MTHDLNIKNRILTKYGHKKGSGDIIIKIDVHLTHIGYVKNRQIFSSLSENELVHYCCKQRTFF